MPKDRARNIIDNLNSIFGIRYKEVRSKMKKEAWLVKLSLPSKII